MEGGRVGGGKGWREGGRGGREGDNIRIGGAVREESKGGGRDGGREGRMEGRVEGGRGGREIIAGQEGQ